MQTSAGLFGPESSVNKPSLQDSLLSQSLEAHLNQSLQQQ